MHRHTLALDFGSKNVGIALVRHPAPNVNVVVYAATVVVEAKPITVLTEPRAYLRRLRRARKTRRRRLCRLAQALAGISGADQLLSFCRRRGFGHQDVRDEAQGPPPSLSCSRAEFFAALREEAARVVPAEHRERALSICSRHLNEALRRDAEIRPARFENRGRVRCRWAGCGRNTPRAENDIAGRVLQALAPWLTPVFDHSADRDRLLRSLQHWSEVLGAIGRAHRDALREADERATARRVARLKARAGKVFDALLDRVRREAPQEVASRFIECWKRHYRRAIWDIVACPAAGRSAYCREHAQEFVVCRLAHRVVPLREDVTEADLSRRQGIIFSRLWSLVERRLLPLAGGRIDRVVVERVAFDLLTGPVAGRRKVPEKRLAEMRQRGPQAGFPSRLEMLRAEFGGRCAYCGQPGAAAEVEHVLPRSRFPFDAYFNVLPSCGACNLRKGARTPVEAGMTVHPAALAAYQGYVGRLLSPHLHHTLKLGLLRGLSRPDAAGAAERVLRGLAAGLMAISASQRSPRPLGRFLATKLDGLTGSRPEAVWVPGRRTALLRSLMLPGYDKAEMKAESDLRDHAVDAIVLGCDLPPLPLVDGRVCSLSAYSAWADQIRAAGPPVADDGLPRVAPPPFLPYFEQDLGGGFCRIDLSAFNWNRRRRSTHVTMPFGVTAGGAPLQRGPASEVLAGLKDGKTKAKQTAAIAHRGLRALLQSDPQRAAEAFIEWLQASVRAGLAHAPAARHPADLARRALLERFAGAAVASVLGGQEQIPWTVGVRLLKNGSHGRLDVTRIDRAGQVVARHHTCPVVRELYVGYKERAGRVDRGEPLVFVVTQSLRLMELRGRAKVALDLPIGSPLHGRPDGSGAKTREYLAAWDVAFRECCRLRGLKAVYRLTQGCVIERTDGTRFLLRNFDNSAPWMTREVPFYGIQRVSHSPLAAVGVGRAGQSARR